MNSNFITIALAVLCAWFVIPILWKIIRHQLINANWYPKDNPIEQNKGAAEDGKSDKKEPSKVGNSSTFHEYTPDGMKVAIGTTKDLFGLIKSFFVGIKEIGPVGKLITFFLLSFFAYWILPGSITRFTRTGLNTYHESKNAMHEEIMAQKKVTGDYIPTDINPETCSKVPGRNSQGVYTDFIIPIKKGFCTFATIKSGASHQYSVDPAGVDIYVSHSPGGDPDFVINSNKKWNLPSGDYYFSIQKELTAQQKNATTVTITAWDSYHK